MKGSTSEAYIKKTLFNIRCWDGNFYIQIFAGKEKSIQSKNNKMRNVFGGEGWRKLYDIDLFGAYKFNTKPIEHNIELWARKRF